MLCNTGFFGILASCLLMAMSASAQEQSGLDIIAPQAFPNLIFKDDQGHTHTVQEEKSGLTDGLTIVHFWATWCVPCALELPQVDAIQGAYADKGVKIIAISLDGDNNMAKVKQFFAEHKITHLTPYLDIGTAAFRASKAPGLPTSYFLDTKGMKIAVAEGLMDWHNPASTKFIESHLTK